MPQPNKIPKAFAASGDRNTIPESTGTLGLASWNEGFPAITSVPFAEGGIAPKRADFNGIFNALSAAALWYQQGGVFVYDNATNYEIGNIVIYSGEIYVCKTANGPASALHSPANDTAETYWGRIYPQNGTFNRMFFSQTSGNFVAPRTGVYRITLKGGGGGGGGVQTTTGRGSGGGGEGAINCFYVSLTKDRAYAYVIGAGGSAGVSSPTLSGVTHGAAGGTSSITVGGTTYSALGGSGGLNSQTTARGGIGGGISSGGLSIPGANGANGIFDGNLTYELAFGGGHQGSIGSGRNNALTGGGGAGGFNTTPATDGAAGFILIEYAG